ncbi:MAG: hypothetical protein G8D78_17960 [gamma proteobacterium symbiont of Ctena orbiculata]
MRLDGTDSVPILHNPGKLSEENYANFYFPDCGSERLFSEVGIATLAILREVGAETVMPPVIAVAAIHKPQPGCTTGDARLYPRTGYCFIVSPLPLNYMGIKTVLISCGTRMDQRYLKNEVTLKY